MATNEDRVIAGIDEEVEVEDVMNDDEANADLSYGTANPYKLGQWGCSDACDVDIDADEIAKLYDILSDKIYDDMNKQYKESKISGTQYADTWAKLMSAVISGAIQGVVTLQNKETAADRALKYEQVNVMEIKSTLDSLKNAEEITASQARTVAGVTKSENETCIAASTCALNTAKETAEKIKNGEEPGSGSLYEQNIATLGSQQSLYERQKSGFDDNARQKLLDAQVSAWSIAWKEGNGITIPCAVSKMGIDNSVDSVNTNIGREHTGSGDLTPPCKAEPKTKNEEE